MKKTIYELLGEIKDNLKMEIYIKYFNRLTQKEDVMWACKENIINKLDQLIIELNDEVEIIEEDKRIEKLERKRGEIMYSYYEILGMIATRNEPKTIELELINGKKVIYDAEYDNVNKAFTCYIIRNRKEEDENYRFYLSECFLASDVFNKVIKILPREQIDILDKVEKKYLSNLIRPFKNRVVCVRLCTYSWDCNEGFIQIEIDDDSIELPDFWLGTMYKGMKPNKEYTLEELGL